VAALIDGLDSPPPPARIHSMPLFWLAYRQKGIACVLILQASSLISARLKASLQIDGIDEHFTQGHQLPDGQTLPPDMIGRLLTQAQARALVGKLERQIPKKAAAASVRHQARKTHRKIP
jgi:hypothetical protein